MVIQDKQKQESRKADDSDCDNFLKTDSSLPILAEGT